MKAKSVLVVGILAAALGCEQQVAPLPARAPSGTQQDRAAEAMRLLASARAQAQAGQFDAAIAEARSAYEMRLHALGFTDPGTHEAAAALAFICEASNRCPDTVALLETALAMRSAKYGPASPALLDLLDALVRACLASREEAKARVVAERQVLIQQASTDSGNPQHVKALARLASICRTLCDFGHAEALALSAVGLVERRAGPSSPELIGPLEEAARARQEQGDRAGARQHVRRTLALALDTKARLDNLKWAARLSYELGDTADATAALDQAASLSVGNDVDAVVRLGAVLHEAGDDARAQSVFRQYHVATYALPAPQGIATARVEPPWSVNGWAKGDNSRRLCKPPTQSRQVSNAAQVVAGLRAGMRSCYNAALAKNPALELRLMATQTVGATGEVQRVTTAAHDGVPEELITCLLTVLKGAKFDPPEGGAATVVIPLTLVQKK